MDTLDKISCQECPPCPGCPDSQEILKSYKQTNNEEWEKNNFLSIPHFEFLFTRLRLRPTAEVRSPKFPMAEPSATAECEKCAYGPTLEF